MVLILELLFFCYGIYALVTGRFEIGKGRVVQGPKARVLGAICLTPFPLTFLFTFLYHLSLAARHLNLSPKTFAFIAVAVLLSVVLFIVVLGKAFYRQQAGATEMEKASGKGTGPSRKVLVLFGLCLFPVFVMIQIANGERASLDTVLGAALGSLLSVGLVSLIFVTIARFKEESLKRSEDPGLGQQGFLSLVGLLLTVLVMGFLAYFMMKAYFQEPPVDKATAASLQQEGIRSDNYQVLLNSVRQTLDDANQREQAAFDAQARSVR